MLFFVWWQKFLIKSILQFDFVVNDTIKSFFNSLISFLSSFLFHNFTLFYSYLFFSIFFFHESFKKIQTSEKNLFLLNEIDWESVEEWVVWTNNYYVHEFVWSHSTNHIQHTIFCFLLFLYFFFHLFQIKNIIFTRSKLRQVFIIARCVSNWLNHGKIASKTSFLYTDQWEGAFCRVPSESITWEIPERMRGNGRHED